MMKNFALALLFALFVMPAIAQEGKITAAAASLGLRLYHSPGTAACACSAGRRSCASCCSSQSVPRRRHAQASPGEQAGFYHYADPRQF